ncbi:hypothetical protein B0H13DRAFT_2226473 [Mycena leptocephala]|nr:hypothetical protein B0H13DRAFT_2226473 [Mycena leptocephala]
MAVIICGDFHQFPPVATAMSETLYNPMDAINDSIESKVGRTIYEEFTTVVLLKQQMRMTDPVWLDFLLHLQVGIVQEHHLAMLRILIVGKKGSGSENDIALVTPRHAVRTQWNDEAVRKMCQAAGRQLFICQANDTYKGRPLNLSERHRLAAHLCKKKVRRKQRNSMQVKYLLDEIEIAIGMKGMVTSNIETDLDLTNRARGEIDIILDPDEPPVGDEPVVHLQKMPAYILVKLTRTRATKLAGLEKCVLPIEPTKTT